MAGFYSDAFGEPDAFGQPCLVPNIPDLDVLRVNDVAETWLNQTSSTAAVSGESSWPAGRSAHMISDLVGLFLTCIRN